MASRAVRSDTISFTVFSERLSAMIAKTSVDTNSPTLPRTTASRSSVVAMTRGVSWNPATWIATSRDPKVNTTNDSVSVIVVW